MEISLHSNQKHKALSYYLHILKDVVMSPTTPFDKLYYADLYCGDGECEIKKINEKYESPIISYLKIAKEGKLNISCFLNDLELSKIDLMKERIKDYTSFIGGIFCEDANICYSEILSKIPTDQISLFFLDPYNHKQLKWETIKKISSHVCTYNQKGILKIRRPELIINCMTYTMTGSYMAKDYKTITENLGTDEWITLLLEYKEKGLPVSRAFLDTFIQQLKKLGYKVPTPIEIKSTVAQNNIYYLVWATNDTGYTIIENKMIPYLKKEIEKTLKKNKQTWNQVEARETARQKGDRDLTTFFK